MADTAAPPTRATEPDPVAARLRLLGDVSVRRDDGTTVTLRRGQARMAVTLLVMERHRVVSRSELADQLWPAGLPPHWEGAVRGVVSKVRSFLDSGDLAGILVSAGDGWRLDTAEDTALTVDVDRCRTTIEAAEQEVRCSSSPDGSTIPGGLEGLALATVRLADELAPGASGLWIDLTREGLGRLRRRGLTALVELAGRAGRTDLAVEAADALVRIDPYSDAAARALVEALHRTGDRTTAIAQADAFTERLRDDLGVDPEAETLELFHRVRSPGPADDGGRPAGSGRTPRASRRRSPPAPGAEGDGPLVGRVPELATIAALRDDVERTRRSRAVLVLGEPGAGKSRLAAEVVRRDAGTTALWGRCSPDRRTSFEPVLESFADVAAFGGVFDEATADRPGAADRTRLFRRMADAVSEQITDPTVWVLDDLHWANPDTTALLTYMAASIAELPALLVLTARTGEDHVAAMLEAVARAIPTTTVRLAGLDVAEVAEMLTAAAVEAASCVAEEVREWTGGNPFFVRELARGAGPGGRIDPGIVPGSIQSWFDQRIATLDRGPRDVLAAAAVLGSGLELDLLTKVLDRPSSEVLDDLEPLLRVGLLVETGGRNDGGIDGGAAVSFAHALTLDAVLAGLTQMRRQHLHRCAAAAIAELRPGDGVAAVASHLALAGPRVDAIPAMLSAGDEALAAMAWSSALSWFDEVLRRRPDPGPERIDALIGLGAALRGLGRRAEARAALLEARDAAACGGSGRQVALASLRLVGGGARGVSDDLSDDRRAAILCTALDGLGPDDDDLRIPIQLELALTLLLTDEEDRRRELAGDALVRARRQDRPDLLARALLGQRLAHHGPEAADRRLAETAEVLALDMARLPFDVSMAALMSLHEDSLLVGDRPRARRALTEAEQLASTSGHPYWRWVVGTWQVIDRILDGQLTEAEALAFEVAPLQADHPESTACLGVNLVDIRLFQGRAGEVVDLLAGAAEENPHIPTYRAVLALCRAESGDIDGATEDYDVFARTGFADIPDDTNRLLCLAVLADVAATIGHRSGASALYDLLTPHAGRQVVLNCFGGGGACWGPVATQLGRIAALMGDTDAAARHLRAARRHAEAFDAPLALARIPNTCHTNVL